VCLEFALKSRETIRVPNVNWQRVPDIWSGDAECSLGCLGTRTCFSVSLSFAYACCHITQLDINCCSLIRIANAYLISAGYLLLLLLSGYLSAKNFHKSTMMMRM